MLVLSDMSQLHPRGSQLQARSRRGSAQQGRVNHLVLPIKRNPRSPAPFCACPRCHQLSRASAVPQHSVNNRNV